MFQELLNKLDEEVVAATAKYMAMPDNQEPYYFGRLGGLCWAREQVGLFVEEARQTCGTPARDTRPDGSLVEIWYPCPHFDIPDERTRDEGEEESPEFRPYVDALGNEHCEF